MKQFGKNNFVAMCTIKQLCYTHILKKALWPLIYRIALLLKINKQTNKQKYGILATDNAMQLSAEDTFQLWLKI